MNIRRAIGKSITTIALFALMVQPLALFLPHVVRASNGNGLGEGTNLDNLLPANSAASQTVELASGSGDANYQYPIVIPPGRRGIEPQLTLRYSSNEENGWVGKGWSLGYAPISRSVKYGPPTYTDSDLIEDQQTGQELVLTDVQSSEYRVKIDNYQRYRRLTDGAVTYWERTGKDGTVMRFGYTADSRQDNPNGTFAWYPDRITDTSGNYLSFEYQMFGNRVYPKSIVYTSSATTDPQFKVQFVLTDRTDTTFSNITKTKVELTKRLSEIQVFQWNGQVWEQRGKYALTYQYSPDTAASLLQSVQRYGFDNTTTYPATTFTYKTNAASYASVSWPNAPSFISLAGGVQPLDTGTRFADVNGDGLEDSVMAENYEGGAYYDVQLNTGSGFAHNDSWTSSLQSKGEVFVWNHTIGGARYSDDAGMRLIDVNGDLYTDIVVSIAGRRKVFLNTKMGWAANDTDWANSIPADFVLLVDASGQHWAFDQGVRFADVNGDGYTDIILAREDIFRTNNRWCGESYENTYRGVWLNRGSTGKGWVYDTSWSQAYVSGFAGFFVVNEEDRTYNDAYCSHGYSDARWSFDQGLRLVDVNGDGLADLISGSVTAQSSNNTACYPSTSSGGFTTYLNTGNGWQYDSNWSASTFSYNFRYRFYYDYYCEHGYDEHSFSENQGTEIADLNGDGLPDVIQSIVSQGVGYKYVYLNTGRSFTASNAQWADAFPATFTSHDEFLQTSPNRNISRHTYDLGVRFVDLNGDRRADVVRGYNGSIEVYLNTGATTTFSDSLTQVDNGIGGQTNYTYQPSTKFIDATTDLPMVRQMVVGQTLVDRGTQVSSVTFSYDGGLYDAADREYRGFKHSRATTVDSVTETTLLQDDIFKWQVEKSATSDLSGNLYSTVENTWNSVETVSGKGTRFPYLASAISSAYDGTVTAGKRTKQQYEYDSYGNVTRAMDWGRYTGSDVTDGDEEDQRTEYVVNTAKWIMNTPKHAWLLDAQGVTKSETWLCYDNQSPCTIAPSRGLVTRKEDLLSGGVNPFTLYAYDAWGNRTFSNDSLGHSTTTTYDGMYHAYPVTVTNALNHVQQYTYDGLTGNILTATDANNRLTQYQYDTFGRIVVVIRPYDSVEFPTVTYQYRDQAPVRVMKFQREISGQDDAFQTWSFFDGFGRLIETKKEADVGSMQVLSNAIRYDDRGRVERTWLPYFVPKTDDYASPDTEKPQTTFAHDPLSRLTRTTHPNGTFATMSYLYWAGTSTDENGHTKDIATDGQGRITSVKERYSGQTYITSYQYDVADHLVRVNDVAQNQWTFTYDTLGRKTRAVDPDMGTWNYTYDAVGNILTQTDARGSRLSFQYDSLNRILKKYTPAGALATYTYDDPQVMDGKGRLTKVVEANSNVTAYTYDQRGRERSVTQTIDGTNYRISRAFDSWDRITRITYPDNDIAYYFYDDQGLVERVYGLTQDFVNNSSYNAADQPIRIVYGNNAVTNFAYDEETMRIDHFQTIANQQLVQYLAYTYDNVGNVTGITDTKHTATQTFGYDGLNRLTSATGSYGTKAYSYNAIGNVTNKEGVTYTYSTSKPHAVRSTSGGFTASYDANGNAISTTNARFTYDIDNRLATYDEPFGTDSATFTYNWQGNRVKKAVTVMTPDPACIGGGSPNEPMVNPIESAPMSTVQPASSGGLLAREFLVYIEPFHEIDNPGSGGGGGCPMVSTTTASIYVGNLYEKEGTTVRKHYFLGNKKIATRTNGTLAYFQSDHLGSTNITTNANGGLNGITEYMPFGGITNDTNTGTDYKYNGKELDTEMGLYYYGARYYDPALGRFMAADSLVPNWYDPQSLNRYSYTLNNPIRFTDPTGHSAADTVYNFFNGLAITSAQAVAVGARFALPVGGEFVSQAFENRLAGMDPITAAQKAAENGGSPKQLAIELASYGYAKKAEGLTSLIKGVDKSPAVVKGPLIEGGEKFIFFETPEKVWTGGLREAIGYDAQLMSEETGKQMISQWTQEMSNQALHAIDEMNNGADSSKQTTPRTTEAPTSWIPTDSSTEHGSQDMCIWDGTTSSSSDPVSSSTSDVKSSGGGSSGGTSGGVGGSGTAQDSMTPEQRIQIMGQ
ncbi:MAG: RHS repeat-associated core domain-containing protein [Candidatus Kerfeldbacteria bacterium]